MDISAIGITLLNVLSFSMPLIPSSAEMETRFQAEERLKEDLFKDYDGSAPSSKQKFVKIVPIMHVDHIREIDEEQGSMTISATFNFVWLDERLKWNPSNYSGIMGIGGDRSEFLLADIWLPVLNLADVPSASKQQDLFYNYDVDLYVSSAGTVRASIKTMVTTPCYFGFGKFPNDYQNCSFTLMSPYYADEIRFSSWGTAEFGQYIFDDNTVADVQDFDLIDIETQSYYMYLGLKVIYDFKNRYKPSLSRPYFRYNMLLKRMNKLVFTQLSIPMIVVCIFIGMSGLLPNKYGLSCLVFSIAFQVFNVINMAEVLPSDYNGMPTLGVMAIFLMVETMALIGWRVFSMKIRSRDLFKDDFSEELDLNMAFILDVVLAVDFAMTIILLMQSVGNIYIIWQN